MTITAVLVLAGCSSTQPPIDPPVIVPHKPATILGRVVLAKALGIKLPPFSGVTATIEGTSFSAVTDDSGYFTFRNVPVGTYTAHFSKPGYGDVRWVSIVVTDTDGTTVKWYSDYTVAILYKYSDEVVTLRSVSDRLGGGYLIA
ncbi:MAG: carboxypeptidase-like regulatory domain-containing protein, partial [Bacteroidota bacterium]|nr:carboxypeptidase-like regulatory domain-containing protein [Bacteroidota bacterium]